MVDIYAVRGGCLIFAAGVAVGVAVPTLVFLARWL